MPVKPYREVRHGQSSYPVYVGVSLLEELPRILDRTAATGDRFLITSPRVQRALGDRLPAAEVIVMNDAEQDKTMGTVDRILTALVQKGARRDAVALAVGGGVVGDTAGFAASIFLRGIDLVHVPTTLLAQVDSSIGGKVAVNHPLAKNLVGSFYPPKAVVCDIGVLASLPSQQLRSGLFEALKAGVIGDPKLFELIPRGSLEEMVRRSIDVKVEIVSADPRESDRRRLLNYGHTIGHAIEAALQYQGLTHGDAIAWGMLGANALARRRGMLGDEEARRIRNAILGLSPDRPAGIERSAVLAAIEHDKKFTASKRVMVLPVRVGECRVEPVTDEELAYAVDAALAGES
jgi:3-dehydroquinate synthase